MHCFMDGRDTAPTSGAGYVQKVQDKMGELGIGCIATVSGRYYAMDRDKRWERLERAYAAMVYGQGEFCPDAVKGIQASYDKGVTDEFIEPFVVTEGATIQKDDAVIFANFRPDRAREITRALVDPAFDGFARENGNLPATIQKDDAVIFANFRPDRAREITRALVDPAFDGFARENGNLPIKFVCMTQYDATMPNVEVAFKPQSLKNTFGEYIAEKGLTQLRIAETEKYAHVTFFFNGGVEREYKNEERALIKSPSVATYDLKPEMSAFEVTDEVVKRIESDKYDVIILNFANCDMVGHTGVIPAAVKAVEAVDTCVGRVLEALKAHGGCALITADHGNADQMLEADGKNFANCDMVGHTGVIPAAVKAVEAVDTCVGRVLEALKAHGGCALITADHGNADQMLEADGKSPFTAHSTNPVPLALVGRDDVKALAEGGVLADLAPTMLDLLGLAQPDEMTGQHSTNPVPLALVGRDDVKALAEGGVLADLAPTMLDLLGLAQPDEMTGHSILVK